MRQLAIDDMQVGATDAAGRHLDADLAWPGLVAEDLPPGLPAVLRRLKHDGPADDTPATPAAPEPDTEMRS